MSGEGDRGDPKPSPSVLAPPSSPPVVLSPAAAERLLAARAAGQSAAVVSTDLGLSEVGVEIEASGVRFPGGECPAWDDLVRVRDSKRAGRMTGAAFLVGDDGTVEPIRAYSPEYGRLYSLMPTSGAPTMLLSGVPMHRVKGTDPLRDTEQKLRAAAPVSGRVLDTATGLGYTAIGAARTAAVVITIELDPTVLELAALNPWSRALWENPRITRLIGDSAERVGEFGDAEFDVILHDPPMFQLAGELYSGAFYRELRRVLRRDGRLFHYIGNPAGKLGATVTRGAIRRLHEAGFGRVTPRPEAFGILASR